MKPPHVHVWTATMERVEFEAVVCEVVAFTCECGTVLLEDAGLMALGMRLGSVEELRQKVKGGEVVRAPCIHPVRRDEFVQ